MQHSSTEPTRWIANDLLFVAGGTAWGIDERGHTFAVGSASEVQTALSRCSGEPALARRLYRAGVRGVSEGVATDPQKEAV